MFNFAKRGDLGLAFGVIVILVVLILPMPAVMLDLLLAISITFSVLVLMTALFIHTPLEFSAFPTVLLIATMMRLALNLASTRLILTDGHEGTDAAGYVIEAFGNFVMQGNFVIGIIVFAILVIVNFVVITKGSGRIAEVAARFTLDAMPGKQMAVDADLSAGLINEDQARARRKKLEDESSFFGAMDGASKFVRGDAIAGLLITFINIIGGMIVGVGQNDLSMADAGQTYTLLTIGDGLVSQIPALIVSTAAGLLVSKAGVDGAADKALFDQLSGYPKALGMSSFVMVVMSLLPGIPMIPFLGLAGAAGGLAFYADRGQKQKVADVAAEQEADAEEAIPTEPPISDSLKMDELRLELGYGLLPMIKDPKGESDKLTEQIKALRRQLASEMGFVVPSVRILDNMQLGANDYVIKVKEVETGRGTLYPDQYLVMNPSGEQIDLPGNHTTEPTFGLPATWIEAELRDEASFKGYTVVDPVTVISTHLTEILKTQMPDLLSYAEVQKLLDRLPDEEKKLLDDIVPAQISVTGVQRILQRLLAERVSIRDLPTILEGIAEASGFSQNIQIIAEHVRARLARQICSAYVSPLGYLPLVTMTPQWEQEFAEALIGDGEDQQLAMVPSRLQEFIKAVRTAFEEVAATGEAPVLLTSPGIRPFVRSIVERFRAQTPVLSQNEIHPQAKLKTVAQI
ncbi:MAG: flagellar biosynthesis protein FlhA [Alphaproteobacteria bacterium]|nr:flagellar biosynthesis protein FlhA [Alphaproteobacteria bacterium]